MNSIVQHDTSFPAWLTLSSAWEQSMEDPEEIKAVIGRNLRRLREKRGLGRRALARLVQSDSHALRQIEAGQRLPDIGLIWRLARVLEVSSTDFLETEA
jgi:ribosome-binding protein aMBF1 (putative translation factor)